MGDILEDVLAAQKDPGRLDRLISSYLPFIKKQISGLRGMHLEYDDMLSLAMLTFYGCVEQYDEKKGNFLSFCAACIRNRLIDENRKQSRSESKILPLYDNGGDTQLCSAEEEASIAAYNIAQEQSALSLEIQLFSCQLEKFGIDFEDLPRACPKQIRSRRLCMALAKEIRSSSDMYPAFLETGKIPQAKLSATLSVSPKTIEKYRKYIVALVILMDGDFPHIQSFLPISREVI